MLINSHPRLETSELIYLPLNITNVIIIINNNIYKYKEREYDWYIYDKIFLEISTHGGVLKPIVYINRSCVITQGRASKNLPKLYESIQLTSELVVAWKTKAKRH